MTVRTAIARRDEAAGQAPARVEERDVVRHAIGQMSDALTDLLPEGMNERRFGTLVVSACKRTPELMRCFDTPPGRTSVLLATVQAATMGLEPQTPTEECWLIPRKNKGTWECQLQIGYKGYLKLAYRSPRIQSVDAAAVYEADHFVHRRSLPHDVFEHEISPLPRAERGPITHGYCIVRYTTGGWHLLVFDREQIDKRRDKSDSWQADQRRTDGKQFSPWNVWEEEMVVKTVVRASRAYMDLSPQAERAAATEGLRLTYDRGQVMASPFLDPSAGTVGELPEAVEVVEDGPVARPPTEDQLTAVNTLLGTKRGLSGDARFPFLSEWADRVVTSSKDLTFDEAGTLISQLSDMPEVTEEATS